MSLQSNPPPYVGGDRVNCGRPRAFQTHEETEEKDRIAPAPVADQPDYAGEGIGEKVFPPEVEAGFAQGAG
jgi:hypothetical protein